MDHQSFRFQIPGIIFLTPVYVVACWIALREYGETDKIREFVIVSGLAAFLSVSLPIGWWIYNAYRVWWLKWTRGGYERKEFVKMLKRSIRPIYVPGTGSVLLDLTAIKDVNGWTSLTLAQFRRTFYPFTPKGRFKKKARKKELKLKFAEHLSDFVLWKDDSYDYARSVSSVRYSLESSLFAIILGSLYALGMWAVWTATLTENTVLARFLFGAALLAVLSVGMAYTLFKRWKSARREYDARLMLTTMLRSGIHHFNVASLESGIAHQLVSKIKGLQVGQHSYAAFDLDNTLLLGDIGEAVFASLLESKSISGFEWSDYQQLIVTDRLEAYRRAVNAMNGLELKKLKAVTKGLLASSKESIEIGNEKIIIPRANPQMQALVYFLKSKGINVHVVTASNQVSAEMICWKYFGIPACNVHGVQITTDGRAKIVYTGSDIPHAEGKVKLLKEKFGNRPVVTAGDGTWDEGLLNYTEKDGLRLWLGNWEEYQLLQNDRFRGLSFFHVSASVAEAAHQPIA
jgi:phosphoserine phosphatase